MEEYDLSVRTELMSALEGFTHLELHYGRITGMCIPILWRSLDIMPRYFGIDWKMALQEAALSLAITLITPPVGMKLMKRLVTRRSRVSVPAGDVCSVLR